MTVTAHTAPDSTALTPSATLQGLLPELVALALYAKQAHWNVTGPGFLPIHVLTDEINADARAWADRVAERAVALDASVDARPATVAAAARPFPAGRIHDTDVLTEMAAVLDEVAATARGAVHDLEGTDPAAHGLTVEVLEGLDKYRWILRAQQQ
jgi:starvation-inducible DNA-binding protein